MAPRLASQAMSLPSKSTTSWDDYPGAPETAAHKPSGRLPRGRVGADYDPFFADSAELQAEAIAICETCPVRDACLTFAVRTGQQYGIWVGQPHQTIRRLIALERAGRSHSRRVPARHPQASKTHCK